MSALWRRAHMRRLCRTGCRGPWRDSRDPCSPGHSACRRGATLLSAAQQSRGVAMAVVAGSLPTFVPPHVTPPARMVRGLALIAHFLRNPLKIVPQAVYEEDYVAFRGIGPRFAWIT